MRIGLLGLLFVYLLGFMPHAFAFSTGETASLVIGQSNFTSNAVAVTSTGLNLPAGLAFDHGGNLWVADTWNNRVLEYAAPFSTGETASLVIGQSSFTSNAVAVTSTGLNGPRALAFDSGGNLWAADESDNRVLEYAAPFSTGETASLVIGQSNFTSQRWATTSTALDSPFGLAFDHGGNLWVADEANNRVLEYAAPFSTGETASLVIGQSSFTSNAVAVTSTGFAGPADLAFDSGGNLWAADQYNHRILEYATSSSTSSSSSSSSHTSSSSSSSSSHASSSSSSVSTTSPRVGSWIYLGTAAAVVVVIIIVAAYYTTIRGRSKPSATPPP